MGGVAMMRYFITPSGEVHGYDADQGSLVAAIIAAGATEITGAWPPPQTVDLFSYAAAKRWAVQTGGITVGGVSVDTSDASRSMISDAVAYVQAAGVTNVEFKAASGWVTLDSDAVITIGLAVGAHVQACFAAERAVALAIETGTITTTAEVDAWAWPSTSNSSYL